jgi:hypothetical protein
MSGRTCSIEGCDGRHKGYGYCIKHYRRFKTTGDPLAFNYPSIETLFWRKVDKSGDCWEWTASKDSSGYGTFRNGPRTVGAHKYSFELVNGPVPAGMEVDHRCHNEGCVNPDHLRALIRKHNKENHSGPQSNSKSGIRGVSWINAHRKWRAQLKHNGRVIHIGYFDDPLVAEKHVLAKRLELHTFNDMDRAS